MKNLWMLGAVMGLFVLVGAGCATTPFEVVEDEHADAEMEDVMEDDHGHDHDEVFADGTYTADVDASSLAWRGAKVGGEHDGFVSLESATMTVADGAVVGGTAVVDMTSMINADLDEKAATQLMDHLMSDDFFGVEEHPTATFEITGVELVRDTNYVVTGDMTIKGITNEESFSAEIAAHDGSVEFEGTLAIDRTRYDVKFGSKKFLDNLAGTVIDDEFTLNLDLVFMQ